MEFTYRAYTDLVQLLRDERYEFCSYHDVEKFKKTFILRHDVDFTIEKALEMAILENEIGVKSTYFVLLSTDFYNVFSKESFEKLEKIMSLGHEIGLHFDEKRYDIKSVEDMSFHVKKETNILGELLNKEIKVISMHRPSKLVLESDIHFENLINSYSSFFFKSVKYLSDSRMNWREDVYGVIKSNKFNKLHILTHPFWYSNGTETLENKLKKFLNKAIRDRYNIMNDNFKDLNEVVQKEEIFR